MKEFLMILKSISASENGKSIIVWHDYGFDPEGVRYSTLKAILDGIPKITIKTYIMFQIRCVLYILKI